MNTSRLLTRLRNACVPALVAMAPASVLGQGADDAPTSEPQLTNQTSQSGHDDDTTDPTQVVDLPPPPVPVQPLNHPMQRPPVPEVDVATLDVIDTTPITVSSQTHGYVLVTLEVAEIARIGARVEGERCPERITMGFSDARPVGDVDTRGYPELSEEHSALHGQDVCLYFWSVFYPRPMRGRVLMHDDGYDVVASVVSSTAWT